MLIWSDDQIAALGRTLLQGRAGQPSLLLVQGDHPESVEALRLLLARADGARLLIAVGIRPPDGPVARAVAKFDVGSRQELTALVPGGR